MLFNKNYIVYYMFTVYYCGVFIEKYVCTKFHLNWLLCQLAIYVPIVMYGLRLFIVVLQELHCLQNCFHACMI